MVDKAQFIGALAETALNAANSPEALSVITALHPMRIMLTSPVAKITSYSLMVLAAGYTVGVLFEKVFPNLPKFRRNVLGIRRRRVNGPSNTSETTTATKETVKGEAKAPNKPENRAEVPLFALPTFSSIWAAACQYSRPILHRLNL